MSAPKNIISLIKRFDQNFESYKSSSYNETQLRREFLDPFFDSLGWDVSNKQGHAEAYKEVIHEDAVKVGTATKAPDYSFRVGGTRKFFVEAKKPYVNIKDDTSPAFQLRRYAWSGKLPLSILTDFEEFAVYDCRIKPNKNDKASVGRILYIRYEEYESRWDEIASIFSKDSILKGSFDKYADTAKGKKGTSEVDNEFLCEIERWRDILARSIALKNPELSQRELNFAVQRTIDRIIFLRICEDRGIEHYGTLMSLLNGENVYARMRQNFQKADDIYNSGLFHFRDEKGRAEPPDTLTLSLKIDDKPLKEIITNLYYPDSPYEFSVLPADILGQVYEQFLGKVIRLTAGHQAKVEDKPEVKKAGGVFYTPTYIVDYIVKNTVGNLIEDKTPKQIEKLKILDPACGSGTFLIQAYQFLLDYHRDWYIKDGIEKNSKGKEPKLTKVFSGELRLSTSERKKILLNNIHGVDIDSQAVEVTKLSLLLKVLEGENEQSLAQQMTLWHERALPDLENNIKCGNSLIGSDYFKFQGVQEKLPLYGDDDDEEQFKINAFDWDGKRGFPEIIKNGGFDVVIGNPPYIHQREAIISQSNIDYFKSHYKFSTFRQNTFALFIEKAFHLLRYKGLFSFIIPNYFLSTDHDASLRKHLFTENNTLSILDVKNVFSDATVFCAILIISKGGNTTSVNFLSKLTDSPTLLNNISKPRLFTPLEETAYKLSFQRHNSNLAIFGSYFQTYMGVVPYRKGYGIPPQTAAIISEKAYNLPIPKTSKDLPYYTASDCGFFHVKKCQSYIRYGKNLAEPRELSVFTGTRIIIQRIIALNPFRLKTNIFHDTAICNSDLITIKPISPINEKYVYLITGVISSKYFGHLLAEGNINLNRVVYPKINMKTLLGVTIPRLESIGEASCMAMKALVSLMIELNNKLPLAKTDHEKILLQRQIDSTDRSIDELVYELYGLTAEEIEIFESKK